MLKIKPAANPGLLPPSLGHPTQALMFDDADAQKHSFLWAMDWPKKSTKTVVKRFGSLADWEQWAAYSARHRIQAGYELQRRGRSLKVWFDLEATRDGRFRYSDHGCMTKAFEFILLAMQAGGLYQDYTLDRLTEFIDEEWALLDASEGAKWSMHAVSRQHYFTDCDQASLFAKQILWPLVTRDSLWLWGAEAKPIIDTKVYTPNREVRLEGQAKMKVDWGAKPKPTIRYERPLKRVGNDREWAHVYMTTVEIDPKEGWTSFDDAVLDKFRPADRVKKVGRSSRPGPVGGDDLPDPDLSYADWEFLEERCEELDFHPGLKLEDRRFKAVRNLVQPRECFIVPGVEHDNRPKLWLSEDGYTVLYGCYSDNHACRGLTRPLCHLPDARAAVEEAEMAVFGSGDEGLSSELGSDDESDLSSDSDDQGHLDGSDEKEGTRPAEELVEPPQSPARSYPTQSPVTLPVTV